MTQPEIHKTEEKAAQNGRPKVSFVPDNDPLRSDEAGEMLERTPSWLLRWGVLILIGILVLLLGIAVMIRYPDTLEGQAVITTDPLPIQVKANTGGRIAHLFAGDGQTVAAGGSIAEIENPTGSDNIQRLQACTDSVVQQLRRQDYPALQRQLQQPLTALGEGQDSYNRLLEQISTLLLLQQEQVYNKRIGNLRQQMALHRSTTTINSRETRLSDEELNQAREQFRANEQLYKDKIISRQEYYEEAAKLRQKQLLLEERNKSGVQQDITIGDYQKQLLELTYDREEKLRSMEQGIHEATRNIRNYIQTWKQRYLLTAPYEGKVHYLRPLQEQETAAAGEELFAVIPVRSRYVAHISIPATGLGKVQQGQEVHLLLDQFPYNEYGYLQGKVSSISVLPQKTAATAEAPAQMLYRVYVSLPDSLVTTYHHKIPFIPEMSAQSRIITRDRNLLQRLVSGMAKVDK